MEMNLDWRILISGYVQGVFPMADEAGLIRWYAPDPRAVFELDTFHIPRRLAETLHKNPYRLTIDKNFAGVVKGCAARETTWISEDIERVYLDLYNRGFGHSIEAWEGDELVGGLYGVALGGAFFGESMFHRATDASKIVLCHTISHLKKQGFVLFDIQYVNPFLEQFHPVEIPLEEYLERLAEALLLRVTF
jgi:leucyl/phenylalanyl-tRNA---protein transferase